MSYILCNFACGLVRFGLINHLTNRFFRSEKFRIVEYYKI